MPDYPWQLPGWEKRIAATGWPEWEHEDLPGGYSSYRLRHHESDFHTEVLTSKDKWAFEVSVTDHVAACLIRENNRVWLFEKRTWLLPESSGYMVQRFKHGRFEYLTGDGKWSADEDDGQLFDTYDAAQAAAVDAVIAEKGDSDGR